MKFFKKVFSEIKKSLLDHTGKTSSSTISSYIVLSFIILNSLAFMVIEIVNAAMMWKEGATYTVPTEHIWIFGLILSHHLGLLFYKKKEYNGLNEFVVNSNLNDMKGNGENGEGKNTVDDIVDIVDDIKEEYMDSKEEKG